MKRYLVLLMALLALALPAQAQTATPTTSPYVHTAGYYVFYREYVGARLTISGTWTTPAVGYETILQTSSTAAWAAFTVSDTICTVGIVHQSTATIHTFTIDGVGVTYSANTPDLGYLAVFDTSAINHDFIIKIQQNNAGTTNLYQFHLIECGDTYPLTSTPFVPVPTATAINTSTPAPTWTLAPSHTPPNTPVPTATILPSSTPGVPTATRIASSTPAPTWTLAPSHTPPNTPVPTATILPSSTPGVPTATILPSSTPGVPTATILPSSTPGAATPTQINTPVDTPTEIDISTILTALAMPSSTPGPSATPTDTPTETFTPTAEPWAYITVTSGQLTRFDYIATAADVHIADLLTLIFVSVWGFFLFAVFSFWKITRKPKPKPEADTK